MLAKSRTDNMLPKRDIPYTEQALPSRVHVRKLKELPQCARSNIDMQDAIRTKPKTESEDPKRVACNKVKLYGIAAAA